MNKFKRALSLILCAAMLISLLPMNVLAVNNDNGTCTVNGGTVYELVAEETVTFTANGNTSSVLVGKLKDGKNYLIVTGNTAGTHATLGYTYSNYSYNMNSNPVEVKTGGPNGRVYVSDRGNATVWTAHIVENTGNDAGRNENDWRFTSGTRGLNVNNNGLTISNNYQNVTDLAQFSIRNHYMAWWYAEHYATSGNNWGSNIGSPGGRYGPVPDGATHTYFYEEIQLVNTYSLEAGELYQVAPGDTLAISNITKQILLNGSVTDAPNGGSYSLEIVSNPQNAVRLTNNALEAVANGTATVRVKYTWGNGSNVVWDDIEVLVTGDTFYTVDIKENGNSMNILSVKGVTDETTRQLAADVLRYGRIPVENATVSWTSSDTSIVAVNENGLLTFTGKEGIATIFAVYQDGEEEYIDQITVTASTGIYIIPADGTNDFPEYPNEGSIRFDKTAVAIGNFNDTGIAQVELSMTGVPFTTNNILDVVLLIDKSSSMTGGRIPATEAATKVFVKNLVYNEDGSYTGNRIYIGCYLGGNPSQNQQQHYFRMQDVTKNDSDGYQIIDSEAEYQALISSIETTVEFQGTVFGTEYAQSLLHGYNLLNASKDDGNKQFCVFMTDGIPNVYQGEKTLLQSSSAMAAMFNNYQTRNTDYEYERYTTQMKANGVTVFTVGLGLNNTNSALSGASATQCLNVASMLLNDMSGPAGETAQDRDTGSTISKQDEYFFSVADFNAAADMSNVFDSIAKKIQEAAKDVQVRDVMGEHYTMIFEPPNKVVKKDLPEGQEFYIEILDYSLNPVTQNGQIVDYVRDRDTATSKLKLYMGSTTDANGVIHYHAASNAAGAPFAAPVFERKPLGSMYYWTTDDITASATYSRVFVEQNGKTYYFDTQGKMVEEGQEAPAGWYNMTSGAYANGTVTEITHGTVQDENTKDDTSYCNDLIIATPYFVYNAATKTLNWTLDKIGLSETVITYFLYLDDSGGYHGSIDQEAGTYPTNKEADLTYTNFQDNRVQQEFPIPQMTWHGAQMSYVFYLVNEQGQPVNRAGRVVPFSEAIYVTDVYTKSVTWSGNDKQEVFQADQLASDIVPDVYTLFDPDAYYNIHVFANENDMEKDNHFEIGGDKNKPNTTYVFNTKADAEKYSIPGVYAKSGVEEVRCSFCEEGRKDKNYTTRTGFDYYDTVVAFAVLWIPALSPDAVVVDYGLDVVVDVTQNDLAIARPMGLMATPPKDGSGNDVAINSGQFSNPNTVDKLELKIRDKIIATAKMEGNRIRITLDRNNAMHFTNALLFYYVSEVNFYDDHQVLQTVCMYTSVRVIPATTIYYEEDYVRFDADWSLEGTQNASATQAVDRPGPNKVGAGYDADNVYGFDGAYAGCTEYSQNAAMMCEVTALTSTENVQKKSGPTATFSFTGTGFDIIGRTDTKTTSIIVRVTGQDEIFVDTYFKGAEGIDAIKQVPVVTVHDLPYDTYTVTVEVVINDDDGSKFAHGDTGKFYLDAVRIYEPADVQAYDSANPVAEAYRLDKEFSPRWEEFGNVVLKRFGPDVVFTYAMFIDEKGKVDKIEAYDPWGPNNELYLAAEQTVQLVIDQTFLSNLEKMQGITGMADMQLGFKLANGASASVTVSNGTSSRTITLNSDTDLNFSIKDFYSGTLIITNNKGSDLVALTNLKVTVMPTESEAVFVSDDQTGGKNEDPVVVGPQLRPTEPVEPIPEAPNTLIAQGVLLIKQAIAAVIIAVANFMDALSSGLQRIAEALFAGGG